MTIQMGWKRVNKLLHLQLHLVFFLFQMMNCQASHDFEPSLLAHQYAQFLVADWKSTIQHKNKLDVS